MKKTILMVIGIWLGGSILIGTIVFLLGWPEWAAMLGNALFVLVAGGFYVVRG